jgi:hypothetical protein
VADRTGNAIVILDDLMTAISPDADQDARIDASRRAARLDPTMAVAALAAFVHHVLVGIVERAGREAVDDALAEFRREYELRVREAFND